MLKIHFRRRKGQTLQHYLKESLVISILTGKDVFSLFVYRSPSQDQQEFDNFMNNFDLMLSKMSAEKPYAVNHYWDLGTSAVALLSSGGKKRMKMRREDNSKH